MVYEVLHSMVRLTLQSTRSASERIRRERGKETINASWWSAKGPSILHADPACVARLLGRGQSFRLRPLAGDCLCSLLGSGKWESKRSFKTLPRLHWTSPRESLPKRPLGDFKARELMKAPEPCRSSPSSAFVGSVGRFIIINQHTNVMYCSTPSGTSSASPLKKCRRQAEHTPPPPNPDRDLTAAMEACNPHQPRFTCCQGRH